MSEFQVSICNSTRLQCRFFLLYMDHLWLIWSQVVHPPMKDPHMGYCSDWFKVCSSSNRKSPRWLIGCLRDLEMWMINYSLKPWLTSALWKRYDMNYWEAWWAHHVAKCLNFAEEIKDWMWQINVFHLWNQGLSSASLVSESVLEIACMDHIYNSHVA